MGNQQVPEEGVPLRHDPRHERAAVVQIVRELAEIAHIGFRRSDRPAGTARQSARHGRTSRRPCSPRARRDAFRPRGWRACPHIALEADKGSVLIKEGLARIGPGNPDLHGERRCGHRRAELLAELRRRAETVEIDDLVFQEIHIGDEIGPGLHDERVGLRHAPKRGFQVADLIDDARLIAPAADLRLRARGSARHPPSRRSAPRRRRSRACPRSARRCAG